MNLLHCRAAMALLAAAGISGCVGPDYAGPPIAAPHAESGGNFARAGTVRSLDVDPPSRWWTMLRDPVLNDLVEEAVAANTSLAIATARLRQARAVLGQSQSDLAPTVSATGAAIRSQVPLREFVTGDAGQSSSGLSSVVPRSITSDIFNASFDASWEIDVFGGKQRAIEQASAQTGAAEAAVMDAQVQVAAEIAQAYVNLRAAQKSLALTQRAVKLQGQSVSLSEQRFGRGAASSLDVERLKTQFESTASQAPVFQAQIDASLNQIAVLLAREPGAVDAILKAPRAIPAPPATLALGDPAGLIRRRPDIRRAERQIAAANAQIGQAVARLFPRLNLVGNAGWLSPTIGGIGSGAAATYVAGPVLQWNVLDFGRTLAQIRQSEAGMDESIAQYEQTVLQALQDAETALSRYGHQRFILARLARASASAGRASALTRQRSQAGTISTIDALDVERQRLQAEQSYAQAQADYANDFIALQKGLGLGWGLPARSSDEDRSAAR